LYYRRGKSGRVTRSNALLSKGSILRWAAKALNPHDLAVKNKVADVLGREHAHATNDLRVASA